VERDRVAEETTKHINSIMDFIEQLKLERLLEKKVKQDKDVDDRDGTQPAKYYAKDAEGDKMSKSTKQDRARHFEKGAEKDDNDPSAYEPAPGDATAKTKPSQHTKKFKKMFGEDAVDMALAKARQQAELERQKEKQEKEKEELKDRHDRENQRLKQADEKEKRNDQIQKEREAQRKASEKKREQSESVDPDDEGWDDDTFEVECRQLYGDNMPDLPEDLEEDADKSLKDKAEKSGISVSILKQVYKRGVAAWRTGHRPGTTPEQWGHARVNSFITGGKTRTTADADLWKQHSGKSEEVQEARAKQAVSGNKVQKYITGFDLPWKGKKYSEIDFELVGIDNQSKEVKLKIIGPKELFGQEISISFTTLRRGRFMATDTSKESVEVKEELKVSDGLGAWIDDFMKSDAPQFKGASKEKRKKMAIAAYLDAGGELDEGKMVARTHEIIDTVLNKVREKLTKEYRSNPEKGITLLQSFAKMMNFTVTDKAQKDGYLFLKMGDQLTEGKMGDIFYHLQNGDSAETIAKSLKIPVKVAKGFIDDFKKHYPREYKQVYETFTEGARERILNRFYDKLGIDQQTHDFILQKDKEWGEKRLKAIKSPEGLEGLMKVDQEIEREKSKLIQQGKYIKYWEK